MAHQPFPRNATNPPQSRFPWPLVAIIVAAGMLALIVWLLPNTNKTATSAMNNPDSRTGLLRLSGISLARQDVAGAANVDVYGQAVNADSNLINGATVAGVFKDRNNVTIYEEQRPVERVDANKKDADAVAKPLNQEPIKPGQTVDFRVRFDQVPATWNHQPPQITVTQVVEPHIQ